MIKSLFFLRGVFILFIFLHHSNCYPGGGSMAVTFFFVLGGFCMTLGYVEKAMQTNFSYKNYILRRSIKFYPLHWICLLATIPLITQTFNLKWLLLFLINASLFHSIVPLKFVYFSFNSVSWYLADTMFFAVFFPVFLRIIAKTTIIGKVLMVIGFVILYTLFAVLLPIDLYHAILYINPLLRISDFTVGIILGLCYLNIKQKGIRLSHLRSNFVYFSILWILIILLVVESCMLSENVRMISPVYWPLVSTIILISSLADRAGGGKFLQIMGECSFTIFLSHQLVLRYFSEASNTLCFLNDKITFLTLTLLFTILSSIFVERYILRPIKEWLTRRFLQSTTVHL